MNVNVVCPHCLKINRIPKKESYSKANCGGCKGSLLNSKPVAVDADKLGFFLANSELPVVVDFWAPWCGPCLQMAPDFEEASKQMSLKAQFLKVDTQTHQVLASQYRIESIPTVIVFKNGVEKNRVSGALSNQRLQDWVNNYL